MNANIIDNITPNIEKYNILDDREYHIKVDNIDYNLRIEIGQKHIYFNIYSRNNY